VQQTYVRMRIIIATNKNILKGGVACCQLDLSASTQLKSDR
jgi:hypothetical protein